MAYINENNLQSEYENAKLYMKERTSDFGDLANIVGAIADDSATNNKKAPSIVDSTTAAIVRRTPKSTIQQMPVVNAIVEGESLSIATMMTNWVIRNRILNENTFGKSLLERFWLAGEKGLSFGFATGLTTFESDNNGDFGARLKIVNYNDIFPEPGRTDINECNYYFVRNWWQPSDVDNILKSDNKTWNKSKLKELKDNVDVKEQDSQGLENNRRGVSDSGIEIVTCFQRGYESPFYTFSPEVGVLREIKNKSRSGFPRVSMLTIDPDEEQPLGRSRVRLVYSNQQFLTMLTRNAAHTYEINSAPPIAVRGRNIRSKIELSPYALWEMGNDPNASVEIKSIDNTVLQNFPAISQMFSANIQNLMSSPDATISGSNNSSGFSKTQNGVKFQQRMLDVEGNYLQKIMENFIRSYVMNALDMLLSEYEGTEVITADSDLYKLVKAKYPSFITEDGKMQFNWDSLKDEITGEIKDIKIELTAGSSKEEMESEQRDYINQLLTSFSQNEELWRFIPEKSRAGLINKAMILSGVNNIEDILIDTTELNDRVVPEEEQAAQLAMAEQTPELMEQNMQGGF